MNRKEITDELFHEVELGVKENTYKIYIDSLVSLALNGEINLDRFQFNRRAKNEQY